MSKKNYNPEKRAWRGRSYKKHGEHLEPKGSMMAKEKRAEKAATTWNDKTVQYPRLLAEIRAVGLTPEQYKELGESMDLTRDEIDEILEWAEEDWEEIKRKTFGGTYHP